MIKIFSSIGVLRIVARSGAECLPVLPFFTPKTHVLTPYVKGKWSDALEPMDTNQAGSSPWIHIMLSLLVVQGDVSGDEPDHLRSFFIAAARRCAMQSGIWETVADTFFWMQLVWILSGFCLMAYLAFRVFPHRRDDDLTLVETTPHQRRQRMIAGSYRFEDFPSWHDRPSKI
jgi:hypothetical protein